MINKICNEYFYSKTIINYPTFKNGLDIEEYFLNYLKNNNILIKRKFIPVFWTNLQNRSDFVKHKKKLQEILDKWVKNNPSIYGYFCVIQHADGSALNLPKNTVVYNGGNKGNYPLPLIYEDKNNILQNKSKKSFKNKDILCSFVGRLTSNKITPNVRSVMFDTLKNNELFKIIKTKCISDKDRKELQDLFINTTSSSKFCLAPRGYGRSSFRFFESFLLGTIPIYIWNDKIWLPFQNIINYDKLCVVIHISDINTLENKLKNITEEEYNNMWVYYKKIKYLFTLEGMTKQIISEIGTINTDYKFSLCIPTMDRYEFLSVNLPKYINNPLIDEIVISDENGNDVRKIKKNFKNTNIFKFHINKIRKGVFYNKIQCCKLAKNDWIALIDSDNFADIDYFQEASNFLNSMDKTNKNNIILAPSFAKPSFNYSEFSGLCFNKEYFKNILAFKNSYNVLLNTMNYIINKNLIENLILSEKDKELSKKKCLTCDSMFLNLLFFEKLDMEMYIVPNMYYNHTVHKGSNWEVNNIKCRKETKIIKNRILKLFSKLKEK